MLQDAARSLWGEQLELFAGFRYIEFGKDVRQRQEQVREQGARVRTGDVELDLAGAIVGAHASGVRIDVENERNAPSEVFSNLRSDVDARRPNLDHEFGRYARMLQLLAR